MHIQIDKSYTSRSDIERIIEAFNRNENATVLTISFTKAIREIDILLIDYLILLKELRSDLNIVIWLNANVARLSYSETAIEFKLAQYMVYAYVVTGTNVFSIKFGEKDHTWWGVDVKDSKYHFNPDWFVHSKSFIPLILIKNNENDNNVYQMLFETRFIQISGKRFCDNSFDKPNEVSYVTYNDQQFNLCRDNIRSDLNLENTPKCLNQLCQLSFLDALRKAKILYLYLNLDNGSNNSLSKKKAYNMGKLTYSRDEGVQYYKTVAAIFDEVENYPPIYALIYSALLTSDLLENSLSPDNYDRIRRKLLSLWGFAKDMVQGIKELAKNIKEHSSPPIGVISGRIYREGIWDKFKDDYSTPGSLEKKYDEWLRVELDSKPIAYLNIDVVDLGNIGVMKTLYQNTRYQSNESGLVNKSTGEIMNTTENFHKLLTEDLETIESRKIHFKDLFAGSKNILNQQCKRAIAHLGLLMFSKLINVNNGLIIAGSKGFNSDRDSVLMYGNYISESLVIPIKYGTNYHIVIPIYEHRKDSNSDETPHAMSIPADSPQSQILGIEEMLSYEICTDFSRPPTREGELKYIFIVKPAELLDLKTRQILNRDDETAFWDSIDKTLVIATAFMKINDFICIDFKNLNIDESQLFRFLGKWEIKYSNLPLIIYNLTSSCFLNLFKLNDEYARQLEGHIDYWNRNSIIVIFNYIEIPQKGKFHFTDVLWGETKEDLININKLVRKTHFNTLDALNLLTLVEHNSNYMTTILDQSRLFHDQSTLLPFELLLKWSNELTPFEQNSMILLQNELKVG